MANKTGITTNKLIMEKLKVFDESFVSAQYKSLSEWSWYIENLLKHSKN